MLIEGQSIWHGDSLQLIHDIDGPINAIITDPPYGMDHLSHSAKTASGLRWVKKVANDTDPDQAMLLFCEVMEPLLAKTADEAEIYIFCRNLMIETWHPLTRELVADYGFTVDNVLVWDKGNPGQGDIMGNWAFSWEAILYAKKGRHEIPERRSSIISVDREPHTQMFHPTQKPVQLLEKLIEQSTKKGDLIVDPFSGSGSTISAARNLARRAVGIELDADHVRNSRIRLDQMTFDF